MLAIAIASIVLAAVAAFLQDDLEHILGYSIVGDAGVVILALAVLEPGAWAPARTWILAFVVARCAFAAWIAGVRTGLLDRTRRATCAAGRDARRSWPWRSLVIALASIGLPGFAAFDARTELAELALDQPFSIVLVVATLAPLIWYGRLFVIGLLRPDRVLEPVDAWRPRIGSPGPDGAAPLGGRRPGIAIARSRRPRSRRSSQSSPWRRPSAGSMLEVRPAAAAGHRRAGRERTAG